MIALLGETKSHILQHPRWQIAFGAREETGGMATCLFNLWFLTIIIGNAEVFLDPHFSGQFLT